MGPGEPDRRQRVVAFNWARDGGDLRVAHFFGIHAMQAIPLLAYALRHVNAGITVVAIGGLIYTLVTSRTFAQAVMGQPFM